MADDNPTYRIKDWDLHFENHQSRVLNHPRWVPFPNKHDGKSYKRIMRLPNGIAIFGAWVLIVEVASKMPIRGLLVKDEESLTAEDLADKTGAPQSIFEEAFKVLSDPKIGWISADFCTGNSQAEEKTVNVNSERASGTALELNRNEGNGNGSNRKGSRAPAHERQSKPRKEPAPELDPPFYGEAFIQALKTYRAVRVAIKRPLIIETELLLFDDLREWGEADSTIALNGAAKAGHQQVFHPDKYRNSNGHNGANGKTNYSSQPSNGRPAGVGSGINTSLVGRIKRA